MSKKAVILISAVIALIIGGVILIFVPRDVRIITSTSSFISSSEHFYDANPVLKIKLLSGSMNGDRLDQYRSDRDAALAKSLETVLAADDQVFRDDYTSLTSLVFEINGNIYYYRTSDTHHVYRLNKNTGEITSCELSGYNSFTSEESRARYDEVDHNYTVFVNLMTEALIDTYPALKDRIDNIDGFFYCSCMFYDNGRVFFEKRNTIYEFLPSDGTVRKIASVGSGETVEFVLDR